MTRSPAGDGGVFFVATVTAAADRGKVSAQLAWLVAIRVNLAPLATAGLFLQSSRTCRDIPSAAAAISRIAAAAPGYPIRCASSAAAWSCPTAAMPSLVKIDRASLCVRFCISVPPIAQPGAEDHGADNKDCRPSQADQPGEVIWRHRRHRGMVNGVSF